MNIMRKPNRQKSSFSRGAYVYGTRQIKYSVNKLFLIKNSFPNKISNFEKKCSYISIFM